MNNLHKDIGVLLIHGFPGTYKEMEPLREFLEERGIFTFNISLRGHNTTPEDLLYVKYTDWIEDVESDYQTLKKKCHSIYVCGFSMGGLLALVLSARHKNIKGCIVLAPSFFVKGIVFKFAPLAFLFPKIIYPLGKFHNAPDIEGYKYIPAISGYQLYRLIKQTKKLLKDITIPIFIVQGGKDEMVNSPIQYIKKNVSSNVVKEFYVNDAPHILTMAEQRSIIFNQILNFIQERENAHFI